MNLIEAQLLNESPMSDIEQRQQADSYYRKILNGIRRNIIKMHHWDRISKVIRVSSRELGIGEQFDIILANPIRGRERVVGGWDTKKNALYIFVDLSIEDLAEELSKGEYRTTIIHELVHMFDQKRMKVTMPRTSDMEETDYYNHPVETNAYYQEALSRFEWTIPKLKRAGMFNSLKAKWDRSFEEFYDTFRALMDEDFKENMTRQTERRVKNRLYKYWESEVKNKKM